MKAFTIPARLVGFNALLMRYVGGDEKELLSIYHRLSEHCRKPADNQLVNACVLGYTTPLGGTK